MTNPQHNAKLTLLCVLVLALCLLGLTARQLLKLSHLTRDYRQLIGEVKNLNEENQHLVSELAELAENPFYTEKIAREELGWAKPGEIIYKFQEKGE